MSDAPEQIFAWYFIPSKQDDVIKGGWNDTPDRKDTAYTRTDLYLAAVAERDALAAEVARLRDALANIAVMGYSDDVRVLERIACLAVEAARAALGYSHAPPPIVAQGEK